MFLRMIIRKVIKLGKSSAVTLPSEYKVGEFVGLEIQRFELRKVNKEDSKNNETIPPFFSGFDIDFISFSYKQKIYL